MPELSLAKLIRKEQLKQDVFKFSVYAPGIVNNSKPGHFVEIRVSEQTEPFLRRPISIYNLKKEEGILEFIFQVKGKGTDILSKKEEGDLIDIIGPLGYGTFNYSKYNNLAIIGGGIGVFPLYELAKCAKAEKKKINTYLGFRNKDFVVLEEEFSKVSNNLIITTDDGSYKEQGYAINKLKEDIEKGNIPEIIYACGPLPMLRAVQKLALEKDIPCQLSLEERMACGLGVCLGCAVKIVTDNAGTTTYKHVCKDGPVFWVSEVEI